LADAVRQPPAVAACSLASSDGQGVGRGLTRTQGRRQRSGILNRFVYIWFDWKIWLRGQDLNLRPSGYEPDELPGCSTPRWFGIRAVLKRFGARVCVCVCVCVCVIGALCGFDFVSRVDALWLAYALLRGRLLARAACCAVFFVTGMGWKTWRRPTLPCLRTQYHGRWGFSRPSSGWDRVRAPREDHQVVQPFLSVISDR
jgi:hypothetical protein